MRRGSAAIVSFVVATIACGSSADKSKAVSKDAGPNGVNDGAIGQEAGTCSNDDVYCNGTCQAESVNACGTSCTVCAQPATSHGASGCLGGECQFQCDGGYAQCATQSCCGAQTMGDVLEIRVANDTSCGVTTDGAVWCWGDGNEYVLGNNSPGSVSMLPVAIPGLPGSAHVTLGSHHVCALLFDKTVGCWGADEEGQLGDGMNMSRATPQPANGLANVTGIAAGDLFTCAATTSGAAYCWGDNTSGQIGVTIGGASVPEPTQVAGLSAGATAVAAGSAFACALLFGGQVQCWGDGSDGQLGGPASSAKPVSVSLPSSVVAIAAGAHHVCAITSTGGVICWGADDVNQLGSAQPLPQPSAVAVPGVSNAVALAAGGDETCAVDKSGAVTCWGSDPIGDVSIGPAGPAVVPSLTSGIATLGVVSGHACATTTGNAPKCWGNNDSGDLGDNSLTASWVPIDVMDF